MKNISAAIAVSLLAFIVVSGFTGNAAHAETGPVRELPDGVQPGGEFEVVVTFTPSETMNSIGLTDYIPDDWNTVKVEGGSIPSAHTSNKTGEIGFIWFDLVSGTSVTVTYRANVPDTATPGVYSFSGKLTYYLGAEGPFNLDITGDSSVTVGSVQVTPVPSGGSPVVIPPAVTENNNTVTVATDDFTGESALVIDDLGIVQSAVTLVSLDSDVQLSIPSGTIMLGGDSYPIQSLTAQPVDNPPAAPPGNAVALVYDFGPDGASFSVPVAITMTYDPSTLPSGINENELQMAYWDGTAWVFLETTVDTANKTLTCFTDHFTPFAILSPVSASAPESEPAPSSTPDTPDDPVTAETDTPAVATDTEETAVTQPASDDEEEQSTVRADDTEVQEAGIKWWIIGIIAVAVTGINLVLYFNLRRWKY